MAKNDPSKTLAKILQIISEDVSRIKKNQAQARLVADDGIFPNLAPAEALTLSRYASTLDSIVEGKEKEKAKTRKDLEGLSTDELIKEYEKQSHKKG